MSVETPVRNRGLSGNGHDGITSHSEREKVGFNTEKLAEVFGRTKEVFFEYNRGGHFTDISERIAKSILTEIN